ncbi:FRIGIDA-like protein [Drosera capensis]
MEMMGEGGGIGIEVRKRARRLGGMWREELRGGGVAVIGELAFLEMVVGFGIKDEFDNDDLMGFVEAVLEDRAGMGRIKVVCRLCRMIGLEDKAPELVRKLVQERKQLMAVKFVHEMNLTDKCPLVPLLKSYLNEANKDIKRARRQGNKLVASGDITPKDVLRRVGFANSKEMAALKVVHQYIKIYNLEAEYPIEAIEKKIRIIEEQKAKKAAIRALGSGQNVQKKELQPPKIQKEVQQPSTHLGEKPVPTPAYQQSQPPEAGFAPEQRATVPSAAATSSNSFSVPASSSGPQHYEPRHPAVSTDPVTSYQPPHQQQPQSHLQEPMYPMEQQAVAPSTSAVGPYGPGVPTSGFTPHHYGSYGGSGIPMGFSGRTLYSDPQTNGLNSQQGLDAYGWSAPPAGFGDHCWQFPAYPTY